MYWQAGGKKANLKKAILNGKGNKDKKVPLNGLDGFDTVDDHVYADEEEYTIIHSDNVQGLGEIASGAAIAAATSAVAAIAGALKQVKGLFSKGGSEEKSFQSETDNAGNASSAPGSISENEDAFNYDDASAALPQKTIAQSKQYETRTNTSYGSEAYRPTLSNELTTNRILPVPVSSEAAGNALQTQDNTQDGFLQKTTAWVKLNPGKTLLVGGAIATGGYLLVKAMKQKSVVNGLEGIRSRTKRNSHRKGKSKQHRKGKSKQYKLKPQNLL